MNLHKTPFCTLQRTHSTSIRKSKWMLLFSEVVDYYGLICEENVVQIFWQTVVLRQVVHVGLSVNVTDSIGEGGAISNIDIINFNLQRSQIRKRGKIGINQSLIHKHPFPATLTQNFYLPLFNSETEKKLFFGSKNTGRAFALSSPPSSAYAYSYHESLNCSKRLLSVFIVQC